MNNNVKLKLPTSNRKIVEVSILQFFDSALYRFISQLTPNVSSNLACFIDAKGLADHLNYLLFTPDLDTDEVTSLDERQNYCREFSEEISTSNAPLVLSYVFLSIDLEPHWVFKLVHCLSDASEIQMLLTFTTNRLLQCEIEWYTSKDDIDLPVEINDPFWDQQSTWYELNRRNF